jgi:hypothetical protein
MKSLDDLASMLEQQQLVMAQQEHAIAALQQELKESTWDMRLPRFRHMRLLGLSVLLATASACCLGAKGVGTATFDNIVVDGTCTGCGTPVFLASASVTTGWTPDPSGTWSSSTAYQSDAITVTGAALGDVCLVSYYGSGTNSYKLSTGAGRDHSLMCVVTGANEVKILLNIGAGDITEGSQNGRINEAGKFNIAVIDAA